MNTQQISRENLGKLYNLTGVCSGYKDKIKSYLDKNLFVSEISISEDDILKAYKVANIEQRREICKYFTQPDNGFGHIQDIESVLKRFKTKLSDVGLIPNPNNKQKSVNALNLLQYVVACYNGDWEPDFKNLENKWYIYKYYSGSRWFVVVFFHFSCVGRPSGVYFKTREAAEDCLAKFSDLWNDYFNA